MSNLHKIFPIHETVGALFLGNAISCAVYGVVVGQVYKYFRRYPSDRPMYKLLVFLLMVLETLDQAFIMHATYYYCIENFSSPLAIATGDATPTLILQLTVGAIAGVIVKLCFAMRVWRFSDHNIYVTGLIILLTLGQLGLSFLYTVQAFLDPKLSNTQHLKTVGILSLSAGVVTDVITSAALCYFLRRFRTGYNKHSDSVVDTLMRYAVNTGVITSGVSLATLITYELRPTDMRFVAMYFVLSKLYAISFLATLNTRKSIRGRGTDRGNTNTGPTTGGAGGQVNTITAHSETFYMLNTFPPPQSPQSPPQKVYPRDHLFPKNVNPQESFFSADAIQRERNNRYDEERKVGAF